MPMATPTGDDEKRRTNPHTGNKHSVNLFVVPYAARCAVSLPPNLPLQGEELAPLPWRGWGRGKLPAIVSMVTYPG